MNTPTAIFAGLAMIAAAIFLTKNAGPALSQGSIWGGNAAGDPRLCCSGAAPSANAERSPFLL
jgi:hypothetical protein